MATIDAAAAANRSFTKAIADIAADPESVITPDEAKNKDTTPDQIISRFVDTAYDMGTDYAATVETAIARHPRAFGDHLAFALFGIGAGFFESVEFADPGTDAPADTLKAVADRAGFTGDAKVVDREDGTVRVHPAYRN